MIYSMMRLGPVCSMQVKSCQSLFDPRLCLVAPRSNRHKSKEAAVVARPKKTETCPQKASPLQMPSYLALPDLYMGHADKKSRVDSRGSSINKINFMTQAVVRDPVGATRKRKQAGTGPWKKLLQLKKKKRASANKTTTRRSKTKTK